MAVRSTVCFCKGTIGFGCCRRSSDLHEKVTEVLLIESHAILLIEIGSFGVRDCDESLTDGDFGSETNYYTSYIGLDKAGNGVLNVPGIVGEE